MWEWAGGVGQEGGGLDRGEQRRIIPPISCQYPTTVYYVVRVLYKAPADPLLKLKTVVDADKASFLRL